MPKVSVIIPVYNTEKYLEECLDSVIHQTLKDIEIICINDGSTDNSLEILKKYKQKDSRIITIDQENSGAAIARNKGIKIANGEYLSFIDSDDYIDLDFLEKLYSASNNGNCDVVTTVNVKNVDENLNQSYKNIFINSKQLNFIERADMFVKTGISCNKIYKNSFIKNNNIYYTEDKAASEDLYFTVFSLLLANKVNIINNTSYYYRQVNNSLSRTIKDEKNYKIIDFCKIVDKRLSTLNVNIFKKICWKNKFKKRREIEFSTYYSNMHKDYKATFRELLKKAYPRDKVKEPIKNLVVSLTSYPARINFIHKTIESILFQTIEPEKIILVLATEEFPNKEKDLPKTVLDLIDKGLEILWSKNIKSYKKLIPVLEKYPQKIIVTADDDIIYPQDWLERLYNAYRKNPRIVHCHRAHRVTFNKKNEIMSYKNWLWEIYGVSPSYNNFLTGGAGTLYPINSFYKDICKEEIFVKLCPNADDIWFWAMCVLNGTKINIIKDNYSILRYVDGTQKEGLYQININENQNDKQLKNILNFYPELLRKLDKKSLCTYHIKLKIKNKLINHKLNKILKTKKKTLLWGASLFIEEFIKNNHINNPNILGIIDKNSNRRGEKIAGYKIYSPEEIKNLNADEILLTIKNSNELIYNDLKIFLEQNHPKLKLLPNIFSNKKRGIYEPRQN